MQEEFRPLGGHPEDMAGSTAKEYFLVELRRSLQHLYDPTALRRSPLVVLFSLKTQTNPHTALRRILIEGIQALKPGSDVPLYATAWRVYHILQNRYVEHFSQQTLAANLGLSVRQLRRQERLAEETLADYLWHRHNLEAVIQRLSHSSDWPPRSEHDSVEGYKEEELEWLRQSLPSEIAYVGEVIEVVLRIADPLIRSLNVKVEYDLAEDSPLLAGQIHIVKQGLLNLVSAAAQTAAGGSIHVTLAATPEGLCIQLQTTAGDSAPPTDSSVITAQLEMASKLLEMFGGRCEITRSETRCSLSASIVLPVAAQVPVLVIDDNTDTLRLFERYLSGSPYRFIGVREPEQALALVEKSTPRIILLDIMLPNTDGWDVLGRLREHPRTQHVPIIVCTILPQEQLALMLGAAAFLRKPVSREQLLAALDQQRAVSERALK